MPLSHLLAPNSRLRRIRASLCTAWVVLPELVAAARRWCTCFPLRTRISTFLAFTRLGTLGVDCEACCGPRIEPLTPSCWSPLRCCYVQVPICRRPAAPKVPDVLEKVKQLAMTDRDVLEKGTRAFVSFVRG